MALSGIERVRRAHVKILQHPQFCAFAGILACGSTKVEPTLTPMDTACTDGWNVWYSERFIATLSDAELIFVVLHEAMHKAYRHMTMWKRCVEEDALLANIAMDVFVNTSIADTDAGAGFAQMPNNGVKPRPEYRGWNVGQIFDALKQNRQGQGQGQVQGQVLDHHDTSGSGTPADAATEAQRANEIQRALRQGEMVRKARSAKGSGDSDAVFGDLLTPQVDWRTLLREFMQATCAGIDESSWDRPSRRYLPQDIYMPRMIGVTTRELVVGFDVSGSVFGGTEMTLFVSELTHLIELMHPERIHVVYWDTAVTGHQIFEDGQFHVANLEIKGGGGTDGAVLFDYLREKHIDPAAIIQFTDGYVGNWGHTTIPTLWAVTTGLVAPFGTTISIKA